MGFEVCCANGQGVLAAVTQHFLVHAVERHAADVGVSVPAKLLHFMIQTVTLYHCSKRFGRVQFAVAEHVVYN